MSLSPPQSPTSASAAVTVTVTVTRTDSKSTSSLSSLSDSQDCKDLADQYLQGLSQLSASSQSQSQSQSRSQSQPMLAQASLHTLGHTNHNNSLDNDSHSDTALATDAAPALLASPPHRDSNSATPPLSPTDSTSTSTRRHPATTSVNIPNTRGGALSHLASAALQPRADPNALLAASSLSDPTQSSSQPLFDLPRATSATRPPPSPDMTVAPPAKPARHPAIMPLIDANSFHRTRSLEATLGVDSMMLNPMDAYPDDIIPRASGFSQHQQLQQSQQSQSRTALAGMPALKFESQVSSQGLSPMPYSTRAKTRGGHFPPPSPTTPTSSAHHRSTRMRTTGFPLDSPLAARPPPPGAAATGDEHVSSPTSPTNAGCQHQDHHHLHSHEEPPSSLPESMYNEPMHRHHHIDEQDNDHAAMHFPVSQRSPSPLPYAGPIDPQPHTSSSDLSSDHQQHNPMSPFAHPPPPSSTFSQHPYASTSAPAHGAPLTRHRSRGLESAMGDMELDTDMKVDSRHSTPAPAADGDDYDVQSPFARHHDAYAHQHQFNNTRVPAGAGGYAHAHSYASDDLVHDREAMDLMDLVPGPSTAHFASRAPFQRRGRSNLPPPSTSSSSVRDFSTAPPTSSRSGSPTGSRTSCTHAASSAAAGGMPVLIPSTTKKSHTNCRSLPAVLEYPDYLIPIDAPIQSKRGGAPAAAAGRVTRSRARNSAPATTSAAADTQVPTAQIETNGASGSSSPAQPNARKRKRVSAPSASTSASSSAAALAFHAPPLPTAPATPAPAAAPRPAAAATPAAAFDDADDDESAMDLDGLDPREAKRIRNTISARRSRARKAAKIEYLERRVNDLEVDADRLRADNDQLRELLVRHGIAVPPPPITGGGVGAGRGVDAMDEE